MPTENKKITVVIDTNVYISGLNFTGKPNEVLELMMKKKIEVYISPFILDEIEKILTKTFKWDERQIKKTLNRIKEKAIQIQPKSKVTIVKEKDADNRIVECAIEAKAQYIISGDKAHLLPIKEYRGIKILSPTKFLEVILFDYDAPILGKIKHLG